MNAVAIITPDPKYLAMKKANSGTFTPLFLCAKMGKTAPADSQSMQLIVEDSELSHTKHGACHDDKDGRNS